MAMGALCALHEEGLVVPDDVSVIGFDDIDLASYTVPRLTTVAQPHYEMGRRAVEMLVNRIEEPASPLQRETLETSLLVRASCKELRDGGQTDVRSA
jgi:DNA-binding LacI/PurR family transcriptional regulator